MIRPMLAGNRTQILAGSDSHARWADERVMWDRPVVAALPAAWFVADGHEVGCGSVLGNQPRKRQSNPNGDHRNFIIHIDLSAQ
jgi:hypothetical protein